MKKVMVLFILGIFLINLVLAIPNPAPIYCENMGYTYNSTHCIFNINQSCELWAFYNGECGSEFVENFSCVELGEAMSPGYECCEGLIEGTSLSSTEIVNGVCAFSVGSFGTCLACGDGVCDSEYENSCNCEKDCGSPNTNNSRECISDDDCIELVCPDGRQHVHEVCIDGECELLADCSGEENTTNPAENQSTITTQNKTRTRGTTSTFVPYQKRKESECPEGCVCRGAVVTCPTENGREMTIEAGRSGNVITISMEKTEVNTSLELEQEELQEQNRTRLRARLSNGRNAEIKVMPDTASEKALNRLRIRNCNKSNNCSIELKETDEGNNVELKYEVQTERHARILGLFKTKMKVRAEVDAEDEDAKVKLKKPWWAFLALESEE